MKKILYFRSSLCYFLNAKKDEPKSNTTIIQVDFIKGKFEKLYYDFQRGLNTILHCK